MTNLMAALVAALAVNELVHIIFEIWGVRQKVSWLDRRINNLSHGKWPLNINTLGKTLLLHSIMFILITGVSFGILLQLGLSTEQFLLIAICALIVCYSYTTFSVDAYHTEIGKVLKRFK